MLTKVNIPSEARKDIKHLRRKYPAVTSEVLKLVERLENGERPGDKISHVGYDVYKVRLPNPSAQRGKSGGFRVIYYVQLADSVFILRIYSKTEQTDIHPEEIRHILEGIVSSEDYQNSDT